MFLYGRSKNTEEVINKLQQADFTQEISEDSQGKVYGKYKGYFENIKIGLDQMSLAAEQVEGVTDQIAESSEKVNHAVKFLADGSAKQAQDVARSRGVALQLTEQIQEMSDASDKILSQAESVREYEKHGRQNIQNLGETQESLKETLQVITQSIYRVLEKNEKIVSVTDMLYGIAKQTNLLSLNASIEAARVGEAGRGFAYVAEEVRKLSEECHTASRDISASIQEITEALTQLKDITDQSQEVFNAQRTAVNEVMQYFEKINEGVDGLAKVQQSFSDKFELVNEDKEKLLDIMKSIAEISEHASVTADNVVGFAEEQNRMVKLMNQVSRKVGDEIVKMEETTEQIKTRELKTKKKRIAMVWDLDDPFWYPATKEAYRNAKIHNFAVDVAAPKSRGKDGTAEMVEILKRVRDEKYDGICISPIAEEEVEKMLKQIEENGTKIIFILSKMDTIHYESLIGTNSYNCGRSTGETIKQIMKGTGKAGIIKWKDNLIETVEERYQGVRDALQGSDIELIDIIGPGEPSEAEAEECINRALAVHPDISMFCATNVGWGLAFGRYLKQHRQEIRLVMVDFTEDVSALMAEGIVDAAIAQKPELWGSMTLDKMEDVFAGRKIEKVIDTGTYEVNASNRNIYAT